MKIRRKDDGCFDEHGRRPRTKRSKTAVAALGVATVIGPNLFSAPAAMADNGRYRCTPIYTFEVKSDDVYLRPFPASRFTDYNGTRKPVNMSFSATSGKTTSSSISVGVSVEAKAAVFATVKATVDASISNSVTATRTASIELTVPPKRYGNATYGVWAHNVHGVLVTKRGSDCKNVNRRRSISAVYPTTRQGWRIWVTKKPPV